MLIARSTEIHSLSSISHCKVGQGDLFPTAESIDAQ